jgi:hypothetical protein
VLMHQVASIDAAAGSHDLGQPPRRLTHVALGCGTVRTTPFDNSAEKIDERIHQVHTARLFAMHIC